MVIVKVQEDMVDEITSRMLLFDVPAKNGGDIPHEECIWHRSREEPMSPKRGTVLVSALRLRKRRLSRHIASAIVYDADLETIPQSTQIALEGPQLGIGSRLLQAADSLLL